MGVFQYMVILKYNEQIVTKSFLNNFLGKIISWTCKSKFFGRFLKPSGLFESSSL